MKLQLPTLLLVAVAMVLGGFVVTAEFRQSDSDSSAGESQDLFNFSENDVESLTVEMANQRLHFEKEGEEWSMRSPEVAPADAASIVFLVNLMASNLSDRVFDVEPENLSDFGFSPPLATIEVELENDDTHRLILGSYDFDRSNIYAQTESAIATADEPTKSAEAEPEENHTSNNSGENTTAETVEVLIVSPSFETAINKPLEDWLQPKEESQPAEGGEETQTPEGTDDERPPTNP